MPAEDAKLILQFTQSLHLFFSPTCPEVKFTNKFYLFKHILL